MSASTVSIVRPGYGSMCTATVSPARLASLSDERQPEVLRRAPAPPGADHLVDAGGGDLAHLRADDTRVGARVAPAGREVVRGDAARGAACAAPVLPPAVERRAFRTTGSRRSRRLPRARRPRGQRAPAAPARRASGGALARSGNPRRDHRTLSRTEERAMRPSEGVARSREIPRPAAPRADCTDTRRGEPVRARVQTPSLPGTLGFRLEVQVVLRKSMVAGLAGFAALALPARPAARGGHYAFDGGTPASRPRCASRSRSAASTGTSCPTTVTIHLHRGSGSYATPGAIWIDTELARLRHVRVGPDPARVRPPGRLLPSRRRTAQRAERRARRARLVGEPGRRRLHGPDHASLGAERFASTLAWSYWQSPANSLTPTSKKDESAAMAPASFRALLARVLGIPNPVPPVVTVH